MGPSTLVPVLLFLLALSCYGLHAEARAGEDDVVVRLAPGQVEIRARQAPLDRVLDTVAGAQGFRLRYDGPRPRQLVSTTLFAVELEQALHVLLSRARVKYAMAFHPGTRRPSVLVVVTAEPAPAPAAAPTSTPPPSPAVPPDPAATLDEPPLADHPSPPDE
jgi:hypothetical protein